MINYLMIFLCFFLNISFSPNEKGMINFSDLINYSQSNKYEGSKSQIEINTFAKCKIAAQPEIWNYKYSRGKVIKNTKLKKIKKSISCQVLIGLGISSLLLLLLVGLGASVAIVKFSGLILFTVATGIGFFLSKKKNDKNSFITGLFIAAIVANLVGAGFMLIFKGLF